MTLLNWFLFMNAAFLSGMSVMVFSRYAMSRHMKHIVMVAGSHVCLTFLLSSAIIWHIFVTEWSNLFTWIAICTFALSDWGVILMLIDKRRDST